MQDDSLWNRWYSIRSKKAPQEGTQTYSGNSNLSIIYQWNYTKRAWKSLRILKWWSRNSNSRPPRESNWCTLSQLETPLHHHSSSSALDGCQQHCFCISGQLDLAWRRAGSVEEGSIKDFHDLPSCLLSFSSSSDHSRTEGPESERTLLALIKPAKIAQASAQAENQGWKLH